MGSQTHQSLWKAVCLFRDSLPRLLHQCRLWTRKDEGECSLRKTFADIFSQASCTRFSAMMMLLCFSVTAGDWEAVPVFCSQLWIRSTARREWLAVQLRCVWRMGRRPRDCSTHTHVDSPPNTAAPSPGVIQQPPDQLSQLPINGAGRWSQSYSSGGGRGLWAYSANASSEFKVHWFF